jgi:hypothetical protein
MSVSDTRVPIVFFTDRDAAELMGITLNSLRILFCKDKISGYRVGAKVFFSIENINQYRSSTPSEHLCPKQQYYLKDLRKEQAWLRSTYSEFRKENVLSADKIQATESLIIPYLQLLEICLAILKNYIDGKAQTLEVAAITCKSLGYIESICFGRRNYRTAIKVKTSVPELVAGHDYKSVLYMADAYLSAINSNGLNGFLVKSLNNCLLALKKIPPPEIE